MIELTPENKRMILAHACKSRNGFPPYQVGSEPVMLRCLEGHVSAISKEDFDNLGDIGSYFECPWCMASTGRVTVLTKAMRTYKARWGKESRAE
jgi:hypothetical protein